MLKRLRRTFSAFFCTLLMLLLATVLGVTLFLTYVSHRESVETALTYSLEDNNLDPPEIGGSWSDEEYDDDTAHMLIARVNLNEDGTIVSSNKSAVHVNAVDLAKIIKDASEKSSAEGRLESSHLSWRSRQENGYIYIAIADTTPFDQIFINQAQGTAALFIILSGLIFLVSIALARWALSPIERSWQQQRRFVADASHELKTPLSVIIANTQILQEKDAGIPDKTMKWVNSTAEEAHRMQGLVEGLLALARSEYAVDSGNLPHENVNLSTIVERCALQFDAVAFERGCTIKTHVQPNITVKGSSEALDRLCTILCDNACKYAHPNTTITVSLVHVQNHARLSINNIGDPIPKEDLDQIFERFYRSNKSRTKETSTASYGLGLAIAKGIVEEHRGTILVTSNAYEGTTFVVTL